ncbi:MAG: efflux RND transporter periplasmic adaptor subunit [Wenzhouxiangellaceae bacterium]
MKLSCSLRRCMVSAAFLIVAPVMALAQPGGMPPALVRVVDAQIQAIAPTTWVAGSVISRSDSRLAAEVEGRVLEIAEVGARVAAGDVVTVIEDTALRLRAAELSAEVTRVQARLTYLTGEAERQQRLAANNLAAQSALAQTTADRNVAESELEVARSRLAQVNDQIERTQIKAPFDGVIAERLVNRGERVTTGTQVVRLIDNSSLEVVARAPLDYLPYVQAGERLTVRVGERSLPSEVRTVVALGGANVHVFELRATVEPGTVATGQTVRVAVPTADPRDVLTVPRDALVLRSDGISLFVVEEDMTARQVPVTTGVGDEQYIAVQGQVQSGNRVIVRGNERLRPGQTVQVIEG